MECQRFSGFTLIELICVLSIAAMILTLAIPGFISFIRSSRLDSQANHFINAVNLARSEAIKKNKNVLICARNGNICSGTDSWQNGWIIFVDSDKDNVVDKNEVIRWFEPLANGYTLRPNYSLTALKFTGDGRIRQVSGALPMRTFILCSLDATTDLVGRSREIVMSRSGRMILRSGREGITVCP